MAEDNIHKQEFSIRNLPTRSVTMYPTKAQVIRDIDDITLKPGSNEVIIYGLTPTTDESSIKVDGKGSATITDMQVELMLNRESFEDVYPSESEDEDMADSDDGETDSDAESELTRSLHEESMQKAELLNIAREDKASASSRLAILENYGRSLEKDRPDDLEACVLAYSTERQKTFRDHSASETRIKALELECAKIQKKYAKARLTSMRERAKADREKAKRLEKKHRARQETLDAKRRLRDERTQFWPQKVYRVILSLDTNSDITPASSRRGSIDSLARDTPKGSSGPCQISLSVSYIISGAFWAPRYDLSLDTLKRSGLIIYRAELCNVTSETWKDAKVVLSTSQTSFRSLEEPTPCLLPWHVRLSRYPAGSNDSVNGALVSTYEMEHKQKAQTAISRKADEPRYTLFGMEKAQTAISRKADEPGYTLFGMEKAQTAIPRKADEPGYTLFGMEKAQTAIPRKADESRHTLFGMGNTNGTSMKPNREHFGQGSDLYSANNQYQAQQSSLSMLAARTQPAPPWGHAGHFGSPGRAVTGRNLMEAEGEADDDKSDAGTIVPDLPTLAAQESTWSESGLTATYDIPGLRTIAPSHAKRRQKIASITLEDIHLSYLLVPKLRAAAFLKARFRNTSSIALLNGPAGLTLDGSYLGNTNLPRCSAGESVSLSLGVDPSVNVTYSKPVVKRSQTGVFNKEGSGVYTRTCTITNTRSNRPLEGLMLDQIPVSEDERLKVEVLQPYGLRNEGDVAKSGTGIAALGNASEKWGRATAMLKKGGEVCWDVRIEPGRGVKLVLEYEARFPSTEVVMGV